MNTSFDTIRFETRAHTESRSREASTERLARRLRDETTRQQPVGAARLGRIRVALAARLVHPRAVARLS